MIATVFWLWVTICPTDTANARCETEKHLCSRPECLKIIEQKKPASAIWRPV